MGAPLEELETGAPLWELVEAPLEEFVEAPLEELVGGEALVGELCRGRLVAGRGDYLKHHK